MKFDEEMKRRLIELRGEGLGNKRLARELGVSNSTVSLWLRKIGLDGTLEEYKPLDKITVKKHIIICENCGSESSSRYKTTKFCGDKCRTKYNKKHRGHKRECTYCHNEFYDYKDKKYCSDRCKEERRLDILAKKQLEKDAQRKEREVVRLVNSLHNIIGRTKTCSYCEKSFILTKKKNGHKYCSDECKEAGYRNRRRIYRKNKGLNKDKRWTTNGKMDYSITLEKLYKRDKGMCHLCNEPTDYNDFIKNNLVFIAGNNYPSIDHVLPIAKGGLHSWDNIKLAHRRCNSIKQDKLITKV